MGRHVVGLVSELPSGSRKIIEAEGRSIGVFNVHGTYRALRNRCPHQGAPLCLGSVKGMTMPSSPGEYLWDRDGEILRCPWHGWEFDLLTGRAICDPNGTRVRTYEVTVERSSEESKRAEATEAEPAPAEVETYPITIEEDRVVLHL
jgi:3-phenylpropionate/trans-cinnamate dioxygenase ferredoxin subunit